MKAVCMVKGSVQTEEATAAGGGPTNTARRGAIIGLMFYHTAASQIN
jgi:hypothetical protein